MIQLLCKKYLLDYAEIYFSKTTLENLKNATFARYVQSESRVSKYSVEFHTLLIDITRTENDLLMDLKKNCRNEIKRAHKENRFLAHIRSELEEQDLLYFQDFYNNFARERELPYLNLNKLMMLWKRGNIIITHVNDLNNNKPYVMHCYIKDDSRCRLLYSASDCRQIIMTGLANRFLHWMEILEFKKMSIDTLDFGGISGDDKMKGIDKFKKQFGGRIVTNYNDFVGVTAIGKLLVFIMRSLKVSV